MVIMLRSSPPPPEVVDGVIVLNEVVDFPKESSFSPAPTSPSHFLLFFDFFALVRNGVNFKNFFLVFGASSPLMDDAGLAGTVP